MRALADTAEPAVTLAAAVSRSHEIQPTACSGRTALSFREVYDGYFAFVWRSAAHRGVPAGALDDVVQEVFIVIHRKLPDFEGRSSLRTWIAAVVRRVVADYVRKRGNQPAGDEPLEREPPTATACAEELERKAALELLDGLLAKMTKEQREVFVLHEIEQMSGAGDRRADLGQREHRVDAAARRASHLPGRRGTAARAPRAGAGMIDLDPESRRILELARAARTPSAEDKARVERRVAMSLGLSATLAAAVPAAHAARGATAFKSATGVAALKWRLGGGALLTAGMASYFLLSAPAPRTAEPKPVAEAQVAATTPTPRATVPAAQPESLPARPLAGPTPAEPRAARRVEHPRRAPQGDSLAAELDLLHRAQAAWRAREANEALLLLSEHRARYPRSVLGLERDALQVLTLCELARQDDAARLARSVLARAPHSPLRASLEQSCALK